jgi:hypothetical protein
VSWPKQHGRALDADWTIAVEKLARELRLERAIALVAYHLRRNAAARRSHAKTWRAKHRAVKFLRL